MRSETRYRRIEGKRVRYEPVAEYCELDQFPKGWHLLEVRPGGASYRYNIDPDYVRVMAAVRSMSDAMVNAMNEANRFSVDSSKPLTPKQRKALDEYQRLRGETMTCFKGVSMHDVIRAGLDELERRINDLS